MKSVLVSKLATLFILSLLSFNVFSATTYSGLVIFGDSLSDIGNHPISLITPLIPVTNPYQGSLKKYGGGTGLLWVQIVQRALFLNGQLPGPIIHASKDNTSFSHSQDYAWASAVSGDVFTNDEGFINPACTHSSAKPLCIPGVLAQVKAYLKAHQGKANPNTLYYIWGGANDIINNTRDLLIKQWSRIVPHPEKSIVTAANLLVSAGAKHLYILDIPDISLVPGLKHHRWLGYIVQYKTLWFNLDLYQQLQASPELKKIDWHWIRISQDFYKSYYRKGSYANLFSNVTDECRLNSKAIKENCEGYLFWNNKHPALPAERVMAALVLLDL